MDKALLLDYPGVNKKIMVGGTGPMPHFPPGTKLVFHFQTLKDNFERTVIDDSRLAKRPAEIFVGKMFKMEVWETLLTSMRVGEVAEFWCDAIHTGLYAIVSKGMRLIAQGKDPLEGQKHMCGMGNLFNYHSTGFPELDELMREPQPLIFIMELLQVGDPFSYKRESWMMEKDEKLEAVPSLHLQGNTLVKQRRYKDASVMYQEAVFLLRTVQSREMPGHEDYINLSRLIMPLVLNYCQCMLELEEYYEVIEHTTELLEKHPDCVKGYYKRAKAHMAVWNEREARRDFNMVANLDITLAPLVHRELKSLSECMREKYWEEKEKYWNILEEKEGKREEEEEKEEGEEEEEKDKDEKEKGTKEKGGNTVGDDEVATEEVKEEGTRERATVREVEVAVSPASQLQSPPCATTEGKDWQQMLRMVMFLQEEGNFHMKDQRHDQAAGKFREALGYVDHLQTKVSETA
ncbi:aryl-hydrocarbon-interacting protein-like 1 [Aplochiton taeniatus]